jgi:hydrogenase nickel incorporation protein HypB
VQINTGTGCHLEADMLERAIAALKPRRDSVLMVENVGNLVCPALFDLGERAKVVMFSVTEGEDKPLKYPTMFAKADLVLLTKTDLLPHLPNVRLEVVHDAISRVMPKPRIIQFSANDGTGVELWLDWLQSNRPVAEVLA